MHTWASKVLQPPLTFVLLLTNILRVNLHWLASLNKGPQDQVAKVQYSRKMFIFSQSDALPVTQPIGSDKNKLRAPTSLPQLGKIILFHFLSDSCRKDVTACMLMSSANTMQQCSSPRQCFTLKAMVYLSSLKLTYFCCIDIQRLLHSSRSR